MAGPDAAPPGVASAAATAFSRPAAVHTAGSLRLLLGGGSPRGSSAGADAGGTGKARAGGDGRAAFGITATARQSRDAFSLVGCRGAAASPISSNSTALPTTDRRRLG